MLFGYKHRLFIWQFFLVLIFILICIQLFNLQVIKSSGIISEAKKQFFKQIIFLRGDIRDRYGNLLVIDTITFDLYNNVRNMNSIPEEKIEILGKMLNIKTEGLKKKLNQKINTRILSGIDENTVKKITNSKIDFVYSMPIVTRIYPHKRMAAHVIGFVNIDRKGQHGVESYHENLITKVSEKNSIVQPFPKGTDIILTIDSVLQEYAEEELNSAIVKSKGQKGAILVLSPKTGEIYAWAVYPSFDPNTFYKEKIIKNWSITDIYEPGSTFKAVTVSCALENMTIDKDSTFFDPGFLKVDKRIIKNHDKTKPQEINLLELFKQSSNVAAAQVALTMKPEEFYSCIKKFKIGNKTNIDLTGESSGLLLNSSKWRKLDLATTAFGQGAVSVTPLQLASAISIIANHGFGLSHIF